MADIKKTIVVGASSGIGRELAKVFSINGWAVGLGARRANRLVELQKELPNSSYVRRIDIAELQDARDNYNR